MKFPDSERVEYARNPLAEVICQLRFPQQFTIDSSLPVDFQKKLSHKFPLAETRQSFEFTLSEEESPRPTKRTMYDFSSKDRNLTISLTSDFVAIVCRRYHRWSEFEESVKTAWDAARETYAVNLITRIGLRYRNVIDRENLNLGQSPWKDLIRPELLGFLASGSQDSDLVVEAATSHLINIDDGQLRLNSNLVRSNDQQRLAFLIDSDFFCEEPIDGESDVYLERLRKYNIEAGRLFRWAAKDALREQLQTPAS